MNHFFYIYLSLSLNNFQHSAVSVSFILLPLSYNPQADNNPLLSCNTQPVFTSFFTFLPRIMSISHYNNVFSHYLRDYFLLK